MRSGFPELRSFPQPILIQAGFAVKWPNWDFAGLVWLRLLRCLWALPWSIRKDPTVLCSTVSWGGESWKRNDRVYSSKHNQLNNMRFWLLSISIRSLTTESRGRINVWHATVQHNQSKAQTVDWNESVKESRNCLMKMGLALEGQPGAAPLTKTGIHGFGQVWHASSYDKDHRKFELWE